MKNGAQIKDVSDTSFWVAYYRAKETARWRALFRDPFASLLVGDRGKEISDSMPEMSRYTEWSVVSRTVIIDRFIEGLLHEGVDAVLNLGAGLDARPYRMNLPASLEWIEVDYQKILDHKKRVLEPFRSRCKLSRIDVDLADSGKRQELLQGAAPRAQRILVLTEGVIPYLSPEQVAELSVDLLKQKRICYWITEYFHPAVYPYLKRAVRTTNMRNAPFRFYPDDWFTFFHSLGWVQKETRFMGEIATEFKRRPPAPWYFTLMQPFIPRPVKESFGRMSGFVLFQRGGS